MTKNPKSGLEAKSTSLRNVGHIYACLSLFLVGTILDMTHLVPILDQHVFNPQQFESCFAELVPEGVLGCNW